jgi:hypothetical protein
MADAARLALAADSSRLSRLASCGPLGRTAQQRKGFMRAELGMTRATHVPCRFVIPHVVTAKMR